MAEEDTPLLPQRISTETNDEVPHAMPGSMKSVKALIFGGYVNFLLIAVPLSFISHFAGWGSTADFVISFIAIVPLASLLGDCTEQCAIRLGQTMGGLLNATFGNAIEAIVGIIALANNELRIVQTSLLGSILSNLLLVLGCSFLAAGWKQKESLFQVTAAQASSSLMTLACITLVIPAAYHVSKVGVNGDSPDDLAGILFISRGTAVILLIMYILYLYFQLGSHAYLFEAAEEDKEEETRVNLTVAVAGLLVTTVITSFCADFLVGSIDEVAQNYSIPKTFIGLVLLPIVGNFTEHITSIWMAAKGKMEITMGVAIGSSIQIAVGVIPLLVIIAWIIGKSLTLHFENFETICLFISVLLVQMIVGDGKSHWMEGMMLVALYVIIALAFWVS